jgi:hypothetical protein
MTSGPSLSLPAGARAVLLAPDPVTRVIAAGDGDPERRWMLRRPWRVRRSFVAEVLDAGGTRAHQERWMLRQDDDVRLSYVETVLLAAPAPDREAIWLLRQSVDVRASYVDEVLDG